MSAIYIIWLREFKKYYRNKSRIIGSLGMPFFFLVIVGSGLGSVMPLGQRYSEFIMPGVLGMVLMFSSVFSGISIIWDKQFGFMKEMLVAPVSRTEIIIGKTLGGSTTAIIQALIMLTISLLLGNRIQSIAGLIAALGVMFLISLSFVGIGTAIAARMNDMQGFQLIMNFMIMPLFFLSGALFPLDGLPGWLSTLTLLDPLTYGVDALRYFLIGASNFSPLVSVGVLASFMAVSVGIGAALFRRMEV
jgi:ABC-2 type transport system permease protein